MTPGLLTNHPRLASEFSAHWEEPLQSYASRLFDQPARSLDPLFLQLVKQQAESMGYTAEAAVQLCAQLQQTPVIQTSHHITPTHGPTFTSIDLISLAGLSTLQIYPIFATSGVPFSNSAWSGALSYGHLGLERLLEPQTPSFRKAAQAQAERQDHGSFDARLSLIGAKWRDHLVYAAQQPEGLKELEGQWTADLRKTLGPVEPGQPWSFWAAKSASMIQTMLFGREVMVLDMSALVADFVATKLEQSDPLFEAILDGDLKGQSFDFLVSYPGKKSYKISRAFWGAEGLSAEKGSLDIQDKPALIRGLRNRQVCPAVWTSFFVLRFLLGLKCLGSFNQFEYIEGFRQSLGAAGVSAEIDLNLHTNELTTGRLIGGDGNLVWPLDWALEGQVLNVNDFSDTPMSTFWSPIVRQLAEK